jgi:hypothetical protein
VGEGSRSEQLTLLYHVRDWGTCLGKLLSAIEANLVGPTRQCKGPTEFEVPATEKQTQTLVESSVPSLTEQFRFPTPLDASVPEALCRFDRAFFAMSIA